MRATSVNNRSDRPAPSGCKVSRGDGKPMNKPKLNYWAYIPPMPAEEIARAVRDYESAGLEGIWISQTFGAPFGPLCAAAASSSKLKLGAGIALAFTRSPLETACNAMDLDLISNGRAVLGLGDRKSTRLNSSH